VIYPEGGWIKDLNSSRNFHIPAVETLRLKLNTLPYTAVTTPATQLQLPAGPPCIPITRICGQSWPADRRHGQAPGSGSLRCAWSSRIARDRSRRGTRCTVVPAPSSQGQWSCATAEAFSGKLYEGINSYPRATLNSIESSRKAPSVSPLESSIQPTVN
jgi:hypothetical protein